jgi:nicotinate phosphoribosyltransferase
MAYKLVAYGDRPCLKLSEGKATLAGAKQVWRRRGSTGRFEEDVVATRDEPSPGRHWEPLLEPVVRAGRPGAEPSLSDLRERHRREMGSMPPRLLGLEGGPSYLVSLSPLLAERQERAVQAVRARECGGGIEGKVAPP